MHSSQYTPPSKTARPRVKRARANKDDQNSAKTEPAKRDLENSNALVPFRLGRVNRTLLALVSHDQKHSSIDSVV
jgi:ribosomal protein L35